MMSTIMTNYIVSYPNFDLSINQNTTTNRNDPLTNIILTPSFAAGVIAAFATLTGIFIKSYKYLKEKYDIDLRNKRIDAYSELWMLMYPLRMHSDPPHLTYLEIKNIVSDFTLWYYHIGGMFLTEGSQKFYEKFIKRLEEEIGQNDENRTRDPMGHYQKLQKPIDIPALKDIKNMASEFRTRICRDVGTREEQLQKSKYGSELWKKIK